MFHNDFHYCTVYYFVYVHILFLLFNLNWFQKLQNCIFLYPHLQNYLVSTVCFVKQGEGQVNWTISGVVAFGSFWRIWRPLLDFFSSVKHKRCLEPYFNGIKLNFNQNRSLNATLWCLGTLIYHNFRLASKTPKISTLS